MESEWAGGARVGLEEGDDFVDGAVEGEAYGHAHALCCAVLGFLYLFGLKFRMTVRCDRLDCKVFFWWCEWWERWKVIDLAGGQEGGVYIYIFD